MVEEDEYSCVNKAQLKIKDASGIKKKKKKKVNKDMEKMIETEVKQQIKQQNKDSRTKAEIAFQKMQEKMVCSYNILYSSLRRMRWMRAAWAMQYNINK